MICFDAAVLFPFGSSSSYSQPSQARRTMSYFASAEASFHSAVAGGAAPVIVPPPPTPS